MPTAARCDWGDPLAVVCCELVISRGASGYLALYRYDELVDLVLVLRVRHQRELDYPANK